MKLLTSLLVVIVVFGLVGVSVAGDSKKRRNYEYEAVPKSKDYKPAFHHTYPSKSAEYGSKNGAVYPISGYGRSGLNKVAGYGPGPGPGSGPAGYGDYRNDRYKNVIPDLSHPANQDQRLNEVDKLFARMEGVLNQLKTYSEVFESLEARLSLHKQQLDQLTQLDLVMFDETDERQNSALDILESQLADLTSDLDTNLEPRLDALRTLTMENTQGLESAAIMLEGELAREGPLNAEIASLNEASIDVKRQVLQVTENEFNVIEDAIDSSATQLSSLRSMELARKCENGQVTLDADDRKVEYQYQTVFDRVPQILYGVCGFNFHLQRQGQGAKGGYGDGYGTGHAGGGYPGPGYVGRYGHKGFSGEALSVIGARANAFSSRTGLTLEVFGLSFGDATGVSADVCFQACAISPGASAIDH